MEIKELFILAFEALKERTTRSILTIVMVIVGSSLMVAISGLSGGFTKFSEEQFSLLAPNVLFISSAPPLEERGFQSSGPPPTPKIALTSVVANKIKNIPTVTDIIPNYQGQITVEARGKSNTIRVFAMDPQKVFLIVPNVEFDEGSVITSNDPSAIILAENVARPPAETYPFATLGQTVQAKYSYVDEDGISRVNTRSFVVKAIMKITGNPTVDNAAIIPLSAANSLLNKSNRFDGIVVIARTPDLVEETESEIRKLYGNDVGITSAQAILKSVREFTSGITAFLLSIAVVALLVGAVGIVTTLYTSVMERTREIGTFKAIGAHNKDILMLFLTEAIIIGVIGASIGLVTGIGGGYVLTSSMSADSPISPAYFPRDLVTIWFLSVGLSALAGLYPAFKASRLPPIVALRRE